jgi:mono/diheme cytochrome c family protein
MQGTLIAASLLVSLGCRQDMQDQPRFEPLEACEFFDDGRSARPHVRGTVARGAPRQDELFYTGRVNGELAEVLPFEPTRDRLERGRERYDIFCSPCHGGLGNGEGMIVQRGFRRPPSYHEERLRKMPIGHFYDVISNGFGTMKDYASRIPPEDRWAIAAYIRALQLSQHATIDDVPPDERRRLEEMGQ